MRRSPRLMIAIGVMLAAALPAMAGGEALERIAASVTVRVCIWPDYYGVSYRNPRSGVLQGIDIDLSRDLAAELGVAVSYVETDFSRVFADLQARRCDVAMMAIGVTPERRKLARFTRPYLRSDVYAVTSRAHPSIRRWRDIDRPGRVVVVQRGTYMEPLMARTLVHATLRVVSRPGEREREVESGRADVFIADYAYTRRLMRDADWVRIVEPDTPVQLTDYAYAVAPGESAWLDRVDRFVRDIRRDGRLERAARRHDLLPIVVRADTRATPDG